MASANQQNPTKFYHHFLYKATLVLLFFVILPLFPSQAPEFINQSLLTRNWELLHLLLVGVAISYGLFSRRNDETDQDNNNNNSKFDTAQSLVSRFLQVSSFFEDDESETTTTQVQAWSNQHYRNEPVLVVAPQSGDKDKPLLLPVRSFKSRLSNDVQSLNGSPNSKRFSSNLNRNAQVEGARVEDKKKENVVLASPIPWRSRSGKQEELDDGASNMMMLIPSKEESRTSSRASRASSSESLAKNAEDLVRKKFYKSCPPPPPPPPPMMFQKSISMKPRYGNGGSFTEVPSFDKELKRSFTSERKKSHEEEQLERTSFRSNRFMGHATVPLVSEPAEKEKEKESFLDKVLLESDDDDDTETEDEDVGGGRISIIDKGPAVGEEKSSERTIGDEGPDVDKKADEFIAKFREQIRLQRIESIKRSARNSSR